MKRSAGKGTMQITLEIDTKELVKDILKSLPENSTSSLRCHGWDYKAMKFSYTEDTEEPGPDGRSILKEHTLTLDKAVKGLRMFIEAKMNGKLPGIDMGGEFNDAGSYDLWCTDAIVQYALLGEIVYG